MSLPPLTAPAPRRSPHPLLALLTAAVLCLSGCAQPTDSPAQAQESCAQAQVSLARLAPVADARAATGATAACLPAREIVPVADESAPVLPVAVTDAEGRSVTVSDISRILPVDVSGTIAATVFALGLGDRVVGRDASTSFAGTERLPVVTQGGHTLNAEAILELAPTVMLTDTSIGPKEVRQQLRDAGVAVIVVSPERSIDTVEALVAEVAAALGVAERGSALATRIAGELDAVLTEIAAVVPETPAERVRVLFLYVRGAANIYYIFGRGTGTDSLIEAAGGFDVAAEIGWEGMKPMTAEALAAARPDVLLMMEDGLASVGGVDGLIARIPAIGLTPAGERRRVVTMADSEILSFGPRTPDIVRALARAIHALEETPAAESTAVDAEPAA